MSILEITEEAGDGCIGAFVTVTVVDGAIAVMVVFVACEELD